MNTINEASPAGPDEAAARILRQKVVPVIRAASAELARKSCLRLIASGLSVLELTTTTPGWRELLGALVAEYPTAMMGMGTVTTPEDADTACELGASFLVSPYPAPEARRAAGAAGKLFIGGGITPAEIAASATYGLCKLFPAHLGGIEYLRTLAAILPNAVIMPTGGIRISEVGSWLDNGAAVIGLGSDLSSAPDLDVAIDELATQLKPRPS